MRRQVAAPTMGRRTEVERKFRKPNRLQSYDYSQCGSYHITVCSKEHKNRFWTSNDSRCLSECGKIVDEAIRRIPEHYPYVTLEHYVVMPNHVHILLTIADGDVQTSVSTIIGNMKRYATIKMGHPLWQKGFHDRVIRDEEEFRAKWMYIETNPLRWETDEFFYYE